MNKMKVVAIKLDSEPISIKVLYEKAGRLYIRTGKDGFASGKPAPAPITALVNKWGFRKIENPPEFRDAEEIIDSITRFALHNNGKVHYS